MIAEIVQGVVVRLVEAQCQIPVALPKYTIH